MIKKDEQKENFNRKKSGSIDNLNDDHYRFIEHVRYYRSFSCILSTTSCIATRRAHLTQFNRQNVTSSIEIITMEMRRSIVTQSIRLNHRRQWRIRDTQWVCRSLISTKSNIDSDKPIEIFETNWHSSKSYFDRLCK